MKYEILPCPNGWKNGKRTYEYCVCEVRESTGVASEFSPTTLYPITKYFKSKSVAEKKMRELQKL